MQIAYKLDKETLKKISKAIFIALQYGLSVSCILILQEIVTLDFGMWTPIISTTVPLLIEVVRQWGKGEKI